MADAFGERMNRGNGATATAEQYRESARTRIDFLGLDQQMDARVAQHARVQLVWDDGAYVDVTVWIPREAVK